MQFGGSLRKANVLAVDDKPANLLALEAVLDGEYNVIRAASGAEAISLLEVRDDIDVILLDIQMPEMDGFETAARIKQMEGSHDIPIVFITAVYYEDPHIKQGYAAGGIDYFGKPFDPEILRTKVAIYASFRQRMHALKERERHIRESEELLAAGRRLSSILESLPVGVLIVNYEGQVCQTNDEAFRILKFVEPAERRDNEQIQAWWNGAGQVLKNREGPLARALRTGESSHSGSMEIECLDGSTRTIVASASPLRGLDTRIAGAAILLRDLTEPKRIGQMIEHRVSGLVGEVLDLAQTE